MKNPITRGRKDNCDFTYLRDALRSQNVPYVTQHISDYLRDEKDVDVGLLLEYASASKDVVSTSEIISGLSRRSPNNSRFRELVLSAVRGLDWDHNESLMLVSLLSLNRVFGELVPASAVRTAFSSENPQIREAALVVAQRAVGVPEPKVVWDFEQEDGSRDVDAAALHWLSQAN